MLKLFPKQFFTDEYLLISWTLTFPPSSCLPHSKAGLSHMSLITMCMNMYPTTKESAHGPRECAKFLPMLSSGSARLWSTACYNEQPPTSREGSSGFGPRAESAFWAQRSILEQRLRSLHSVLWLQLLHKRGAKSNKCLTSFSEASNCSFNGWEHPKICMCNSNQLFIY